MSLSDVLYQHQESIGTKAYTRSEVSRMAERNGAVITKIDVTVSPYYDLLCERNRVARFGASVLAGLMGRSRCGWYMRIDMRKL